MRKLKDTIAGEILAIVNAALRLPIFLSNWKSTNVVMISAKSSGFAKVVEAVFISRLCVEFTRNFNSSGSRMSSATLSNAKTNLRQFFETSHEGLL